MKRCRYIPTFIVLFVWCLSTAPAVAGDEKFYLPEMERAVDRAIAAWQTEDRKGLKKALETLMLNETYLLAVGASTKQRSYLTHVPGNMVENPNAVAAYLFLVRQAGGESNSFPGGFLKANIFNSARFQNDGLSLFVRDRGALTPVASARFNYGLLPGALHILLPGNRETGQ